MINAANKYAIFTCDTEFTPPWYEGSWGSQERRTFKEGISRVDEILGKLGVRGTFYCQGVMVQEFPQLIQGLSKRHLIGSHGYNHENYGGRLLEAFHTEEPLPIDDKNKKIELLQKCIKIHREVLGYEPEVFCAPFNSIDYDLMRVLESMNIKVDSSFNNYRLGLSSHLFNPIAFSIYELPFTVVRLDKFGYRNVLQGLTYDYERLSDVLKNEIVFITCHPYEFIDIKTPHPREALIVGSQKTATLEKLIRDLARNGYEFIDPLILLQRSLCESNVA